jgi:hypothetical protein
MGLLPGYQTLGLLARRARYAGRCAATVATRKVRRRTTFPDQQHQLKSIEGGYGIRRPVKSRRRLGIEKRFLQTAWNQSIAWAFGIWAFGGGR